MLVFHADNIFWMKYFETHVRLKNSFTGIDLCVLHRNWLCKVFHQSWNFISVDTHKFCLFNRTIINKKSLINIKCFIIVLYMIGALYGEIVRLYCFSRLIIHRNYSNSGSSYKFEWAVYSLICRWHMQRKNQQYKAKWFQFTSQSIDGLFFLSS